MVALLCLLCNITKGCSALPALQHHRGLLCPVCSTTSQRVALPCLLYNFTEGNSTLLALHHHRGKLYFACSASSQRAALLCLLCITALLCSTLSDLQQSSILLCSVCSTTSQRGSSALPTLHQSFTLLCSLQQQSHWLLRGLPISNSQTHIPNHTLLFIDHTYSLQQDSISLQRVFTVC